MNTDDSSTQPSPRRPSTGAVLVVVLLAMIALLGMGLTGLYLTSGSIQMSANISMRNQALYVAEAGIQTAKNLLNQPVVSGLAPNLSSLLQGSSPITTTSVALPSGFADEPFVSGDQANGCLGPKRGAILRDEPGRGCRTDTSAYAGCNYPTTTTHNETPPADMNSAPTQFMGQYTLFIRQDLAECRKGSPSFTQDNNGTVIIRSEGTASDNRTRVVIEATMTANPNIIPTPSSVASICTAGAAGCDDNSSVQQGITVAGNGNLPGGGGAGGNTGTGTGTGTGGGGGTGTGTGTGTGGGGGNTAGNSTGCGSGVTCAGSCCAGTCCNNTCCAGTCTGTTCCVTGTTYCAANTCCPSGQGCSSGHCCASGATWCGSACCTGTCTSGVCCATGTTYCNGACCASGTNCCNNACCSGTCTSNTCCATGTTYCAANTCCTSGQTCCNNACCSGTCTGTTCCATGTTYCSAGICCASGLTCVSGHCCATGSNWCGAACCSGTCTSGTCCATGTTYCSAGNCCTSAQYCSGTTCKNCLKYAVLANSYNSNKNDSCITIGGGTTITGKIGMYSHASAPSCQNNCSSCVSGGTDFDVSPSYTASTFPAPSCGANRGDLTINSGQNITISAASPAACYSSISLNAGGTLNLNSGNYVVSGNLNLNGSATLHINGPAKLWVLTAPSMDSTVSVNGGDPNDFWLIYNGTGSPNNNGGNNFTGIIYAPLAQIHLNYHVTGAVIGGQVILNTGCRVNLPTTSCVQL